MKQYDLTKIPMGADNVLNIQDANTYGCQVINYAPGHSVLVIQLISNELGIKKQIIFENVVYFSGPFMWGGANFCTASLEEHGKLVDALHNSSVGLETSYAFLKNQSQRLFVVSLPQVSVKILSNAVTITE